jgi:GNAT superfamily N-acetyltransferase
MPPLGSTADRMASRDTMLDTEQRLTWLERALYEGFARIYGSEVITTPSWVQIITPSLNNPMRNSVCLNITPEAEVDERIRETVRLYESKGLQCAWIVGPRTKPHGIGERLLAAGFRLLATASGMTVDLSELSLPEAPPNPEPRIDIELLGEHNLDAWLHVHQTVWGVKPELAARMREVRQRRAFDTRHGVLEYVALANGAPMGIASVHLFDEFAHLSDGAILPEFRKQGVFLRLVRKRLELLRELGRSFVTVHAIQSTSAPILQKMGFRRDCDFTYYIRSA